MAAKWKVLVLIGLLAALLVGCSLASEERAAQTTPTPRLRTESEPVAANPTLAASPTIPGTPTAVPTLAPTPTPEVELSAEEWTTLDSLAQIADHPLYTMHYTGAYRRASLPAESGGRSDLEPPPAWACSLFAALGDAQNQVYGRNFDWEFSPALLLFTDPPDGYASVSMVDIAYLGFRGSQSKRLLDLPLAERRALLDAPWLPFDGKNEYGLVVGMAAVPPGDMEPDPGKETIGSVTVIREMLDHARDVDEALAILDSYNVDMGGGPPIHYLVADRSGRSLLLEFYRGELHVLANETPWHQATNFLRSAADEAARGRCWRYDAIEEQLSATAGRLDAAGAMELLSTVAQPNTQWSIVYDLSGGGVQVVMDRAYDEVHSLRLDLADGSAAAPPTPREVEEALLADLAKDEGLIAFSSYRDGESEIYTMRPDGSDLVRLTMDVDRDTRPAWSPDGRQLAFTSNRKTTGRTMSGRFNIYLMPVSPETPGEWPEPTLLTDIGGSNSSPDWSPDGQSIAFQSTRDGNLDVYVMATGGGYPRKLTEHPAADHSPAWSPDGAKIAFVSDRDGNKEGQRHSSGIYVMAADGSNQTRLTFASDYDKGPAWSPDGRFIVYYASWLRNAEIWVMRADGSARVQLTTHADFDGFPAWWSRSAVGPPRSHHPTGLGPAGSRDVGP